jgi:sterol desaturase/sphingolipid hydroxylase (fatty acid hydroxylase superfamily)
MACQPNDLPRSLQASDPDIHHVMQWLADTFAQSWVHMKMVGTILLIGLVIEALRPAQRGQPYRHIGFNIAYIAFIILINNVLMPPLMALMQPVVQHYGLRIPVAFPDGIGWQVLQALAFFFIYDFFYYWFHRAQHTFSAAWPIHKLHHSETSLNITTTMRHHWLEDPIRVWLILLPIGLLFEQKPVTVAWLATAMMLVGYFVHLNIRLPLGPLTPVFAGPQWHRLHHSTEARHLDRNFASFFPIFDIVFGTYTKPERGEYPTTGLHSRENLNGPIRATLSPFRDWFDMLRRQRQPAVAQSEQGTIDSSAN